MKKIFLVIGILALIASQVNAEIILECDGTANSTFFNCTEIGTNITYNLTNIEQNVSNILGNLTTIANGTVYSNFSAMLNHTIMNSLTDYIECKEVLGQAKVNISKAGEFDNCQNAYDDLKTETDELRSNLTVKAEQYANDVRNMQSQCDASKVGLVSKATLDACQAENSNNTMYLALAAIGGAVAYHFLFIRPKKRTETESRERTGDAYRDRIPK